MVQPLFLADASAVVTLSEPNEVLRNVSVLCENGQITSIGSTLVPPSGALVIDARNLVVYPGLVNTHHHFFQAFVRNQAGLDWTRLTLLEWLQRIYPVFCELDEECIYHASLVSMAELVRYGCTTAFDHQYCFPDKAGKQVVDRQFDAAQQLGMRLIVGRGTNTLPESEGSTIPSALCESTQEFIDDCERLIDRYHDSSPGSFRGIVVAPCQPINCYPDTFHASMALARDKGVRLHTHLAEGESEAMIMRHGMRPLQWCDSIGFVGEDVFFAHGWEFDQQDMQEMAKTGSGLSHCPVPMALVADGITDLHSAKAAGVRVGLGVDGAASNDGSNLLESLRFAYLMQALASPERADPAPEPADLLHYATRGGADLLGRPDIGFLAPGQRADLFAIRTDQLSWVGADHDPVRMLATVGSGGPVALTVVEGACVWRDNELVGLDEEKLYRDAAQCFRERVWNSVPMQALRTNP